MDEKVLEKAIAKAKSNDQRAFAFLYDCFWGYLFNYLLKKCKDSLLAEDLALKSLAKAFDKIDTYDTRFSFKTWLISISNNIQIDQFRKQQRRKEYTSVEEKQILEVADMALSPEDLLISNQNLKKLKENIRALNPSYATILKMRIFEELSYKEITERTQLPLNTVKVSLLRAKKVLAQKLQENED